MKNSKSRNTRFLDARLQLSLLLGSVPKSGLKITDSSSPSSTSMVPGLNLQHSNNENEDVRVHPNTPTSSASVGLIRGRGGKGPAPPVPTPVSTPTVPQDWPQQKTNSQPDEHADRQQNHPPIPKPRTSTAAAAVNFTISDDHNRNFTTQGNISADDNYNFNRDSRKGDIAIGDVTPPSQNLSTRILNDPVCRVETKGQNNTVIQIVWPPVEDQAISKAYEKPISTSKQQESDSYLNQHQYYDDHKIQTIQNKPIPPIRTKQLQQQLNSTTLDDDNINDKTLLENISLNLDNFRLCTVLGRGHFGKVSKTRLGLRPH